MSFFVAGWIVAVVMEEEEDRQTRTKGSNSLEAGFGFRTGRKD